MLVPASAGRKKISLAAWVATAIAANQKSAIKVFIVDPTVSFGLRTNPPMAWPTTGEGKQRARSLARRQGCLRGQRTEDGGISDPALQRSPSGGRAPP